MLAPQPACLVGSLMLVAAAGRSALVPFSGWLPRAMEGPTPTIAIFYGALSVHLAAFLLLRIGPIPDISPALSGLVLALGMATAALAYLAGSVQTDIKSALAYASLTQVSIIVVEIGLGFRYVALIHLLGHATPDPPRPGGPLRPPLAAGLPRTLRTPRPWPSTSS